MTFDPTANRIEFQLLTKEEQKALMAWPHGWELHFVGVWYDAEGPDGWDNWAVYRGKPAPVVVSKWRNIYDTGFSAPYESREEADEEALFGRIAVLRIDTINGKRDYNEEEI